MKAVYWIVPVVLAVGIGVWLMKSGRELGELRKEAEEIGKQVESGKPAVGRDGGMVLESGQSVDKASGKAPVVKDGRVNWRVLASYLAEQAEDSATPEMFRVYEAMQAKLGAMDQAGLEAALDEIGGLGLDGAQRSALEAEVVSHLMEKDPQGVLKRFDDRVGNDDDDVGWILSEALGKWAKQDPVGAMKWMDEKIKEGKFESTSLDGYSETRVEYEAVLMAHLLGVQDAQAVERMRVLPEDERLIVLEQMDLTALSDGAQRSYANLVRTMVPEDEREAAFGYVASELVYEGGYEAVQAFLDRVQATPAERLEAAKEAAAGKLMAILEEGSLSAGDLDEMRRWVGAQAPGEVDMITGAAIGEAYDEDGNLKFEQARKFLLDLHAKTGSDDLLVGFLQSFAAQENPEEVGNLVELIKDPEKKQLFKEVEK